MKNNLMIFENKKVEVFELNGQVFFNPKDVGECLNMTESTVRDHLKEMNLNKKVLLKNSDVDLIDFRKLNNRGETFITESGLYDLIFKSRKKEAIKFKDWVTDEVLPQIRKTGGYVKEENEEEFIKNYFPSFSEEVKQAMVLDLKHQNEKIQKELEEKNRFLNQISASTNSILVRDVAHLATKENIKIGERRLWTRLREWGLIQKNSTKPMQKALEQGLFEKNEFVIQRSSGPETKFTTKVTGKGQVYIINRLLKEAN
ncbi:phage antirepressor KilAC domain-containing protein [Clostridium thermobutyricum]|uniref:phage antirepressor n=1 Tax=Clostridium thermobutyricum TaxID=29372 RepID=UPI0029422150|nr:phage antirepressor KilAC domain-containing protein [Clostridium thermobutyricum]